MAPRIVDLPIVAARLRHAVNRPARRVGCVGFAALLGACSGPSLSVHADGPHFVDGQRLERDALPFRYYGTAVVDALPRDDARGRPDWSRSPSRTLAPLPPPAPRWLFPFDLPIELLQRALSGADDRSVTATTEPAGEVVVEGYQPELQPLRLRAFAARIDR